MIMYLGIPISLFNIGGDKVELFIYDSFDILSY